MRADMVTAAMVVCMVFSAASGDSRHPVTSSAAPCVVEGRATASCFGGGPHSVSPTDATAVLQAALSSNASYLLIDDIAHPWIVCPLMLSGVSDMVVELQPSVSVHAIELFVVFTRFFNCFIV